MKTKQYKGVKPSEHFKEFKEDDKVALAENSAHQVNIPKTFLGRTGVVLRKISGAYEVKFLNGKTYKNLIIKPIHLKKIG